MIKLKVRTFDYQLSLKTNNTESAFTIIKAIRDRENGVNDVTEHVLSQTVENIADKIEASTEVAKPKKLILSYGARQSQDKIEEIKDRRVSITKLGNVRKPYPKVRKYSRVGKNGGRVKGTGKSWTAVEDDLLLGLMKAEFTIPQIIKNKELLRTHTVGGINTRINAILRGDRRSLSQGLFDKVALEDFSNFRRR